MKQLEVRQKYSAARRIFNSLLGVSSGDETLHLMFDILLDIYVCNTGKEQVGRWEWAASKQSLQTPWAFFSHRPRSSCFTGGFPFCAPLQFGASSQCSRAIVNLYFLKLLWILDFADHPSTAWTLSGTPFQFTVSSLCAILIITNL